jgi:hypothetical protein
MSVRHPLTRLALSAAALWGATAVSVPLPASACGGLFCARTPVDQAGEKILFIQDGDSVIAHVQIQYQGDAKDFSWVVPVPTEPTLGVGSDALFQQMRTTTRPTFTLNMTTDGTCKAETRMMSPRSANTAGAPGGVNVVSQAQVGPYDTAVLKADDPGALKKWLTDNAYVIPDKLDPLLDPYVAGKYFFVALKLTKDRSAGDVQPIVLKYKATKPGIPIRLTSVAAIPNMAVFVWVLGDHRAIPENYRHAVINEARIDWVNAGQNYSQVVTDAMTEAGGQAFVTDYAGNSSAVTLDSFKTDGFNLDALRQATDPIKFAALVRDQGYFTANVQSFGGGPAGPSPYGLEAAFLKRYIAKPDSLKDVDDATFYGSLATYATQLSAAQTTVDTTKAVQELQDTFVKPFDDIRAQFAKHSYMTGLFTTMSPAQMTQDPTFLFNPDLPKVSNVHTAEGVVKCSSGVFFTDAPILIKLKNGTTYYAQRNTGTGTGNKIAIPATERIEQLKPTGPASLIADHHTLIQKALAGESGGAIAYDPSTGGVVSVARAGGFGCTGCAANNSPMPPLRQGAGEGLAYGLMVMGWFGFRRYRKR